MRSIVAWAVAIVLVGVGVAVWLLIAYTGGNADASRVQLEAIRTAGTIVVGTGGAAALLLAARRQRSTEIALKQKDRDQALQERVPATTDAEARRITDLYTKAAEQLAQFERGAPPESRRRRNNLLERLKLQDVTSRGGQPTPHVR